MFFHRLVIIACTYIFVYVHTILPFLFCDPSFSQKSCISRRQFEEILFKFFCSIFLFDFFVQFLCSIFVFSLGFCECCIFDIFDPSRYSTRSNRRICCFHDQWRWANSEKQLGFTFTVSTRHVQANQVFFHFFLFFSLHSATSLFLISYLILVFIDFPYTNQQI